jgi:YrhK-like protein
VSGYVEVPKGWKRVSSEGPGPFSTHEVLARPDGTEVHWESRAHRKGSPGRHRSTGAGREPVWWRPRRRSWWMAVLFAIGSLCFAAGGLAAQWSSFSAKAIAVTFFAGSIFFTSAAYLQYSETVNADHRLAPEQHRWRPASWEPRRIDWLAAFIQFIGTLFFNVTTFTAMNTSLTTTQINHRVWAPDAIGSIAFLISSELAFAEVCHRWFGVDWRSLSWRIVAVNLLGSIFFGISAIGSWVEPSTGQAVSTHIANGGTWLGGVCFLAGALLLMPEAAREEERAVGAPQPPPVQGAAVAVSS